MRPAPFLLRPPPFEALYFEPFETGYSNSSKGFEMPEVRMSLSEASALLGIAPNSVRSRYKSGKIRGERDNEGRIWVWVDPAAPPSKLGSKSKPSNSSIEGSKRSEFEALQDHIATLKQQLDAATAEVAELRPKAAERDRLEAEVAGLHAQIELLKTDRDEWRRTAQTQLQAPSKTGFLGLFRRR